MTTSHTCKQVLAGPSPERRTVAADENAEKTSGNPRYQEIAKALRDRIAAGDFNGTDDKGKPKPLPSVADLSSDFGVADGTVRKALGVLRTEGLIDMKQGHGTFVRRWKPIFRDANARLAAAHWGQGKSIWSADVDPVERDFGTQWVSLGETDEAPAKYRALLRTDQVFLRNRIYVVDGRRVMWARSYLPADVVSGTAIAVANTGPGGTFARLAEIGLTMALFAEEVEVRRPLPEEQKQLRIGADEPVARIIRMNATDDERIVEVTDMVAVGEAYRFRWTFTS